MLPETGRCEPVSQDAHIQHNAIIYFDIAAVIIMLFSFASLLLRGLTRGAANRVYLSAMGLVSLTAIAALAGDVYDVLVSSGFAQGGAVPDGSLVVPGCIATVYFVLRSFMAPAYLVLIATVSDTTHRFTEGVVIKVLLWVPMIVVALFIVANPLHHLVFTFEGGVLQRGVFLQVLYVEAAYYSIVGIIWLVRWHKLFSTNEFATLVMLYPIMLAATAIQYNVPGVRLEMFVTAIAMMLVSAFVIHPETRHNLLVNAASLSAYREMVSRAFITDKRLCLVYIEIVNIEQLRELVGRVELQSLLRGVSKRLASTLEHDDVLYYLQNGAFCISSRNVDLQHALGIAWKTHEEGKAGRSSTSATSCSTRCARSSARSIIRRRGSNTWKSTSRPSSASAPTWRASCSCSCT